MKELVLKYKHKIFCDMSINHSIKKVGIGYIHFEEEKRKVRQKFQKKYNPKTQVDYETQAVKNVLKYIKSHNLKNVLIFTDSRAIVAKLNQQQEKVSTPKELITKRIKGGMDFKEEYIYMYENDVRICWVSRKYNTYADSLSKVAAQNKQSLTNNIPTIQKVFKNIKENEYLLQKPFKNKPQTQKHTNKNKIEKKQRKIVVSKNKELLLSLPIKEKQEVLFYLGNKLLNVYGLQIAEMIFTEGVYNKNIISRKLPKHIQNYLQYIRLFFKYEDLNQTSREIMDDYGFKNYEEKTIDYHTMFRKLNLELLNYEVEWKKQFQQELVEKTNVLEKQLVDRIFVKRTEYKSAVFIRKTGNTYSTTIKGDIQREYKFEKQLPKRKTFKSLEEVFKYFDCRVEEVEKEKYYVTNLIK